MVKHFIHLKERTLTSNKLVSVCEVLFYIILYFISFVFAEIHGFFRINDGYFEVAQVIRYELIDEIVPSKSAFDIYYQYFPFFRPLFPYSMAVISAVVYKFIGIQTSIEFTGIFLVAFAGVVSMIYFSKTAQLITNGKISKRLSRLLYTSVPAFVVYWGKFSSDVFFLLPLSIAFYYLVLLSRDKDNKEFNVIVFVLCVFISVLIRELGIFLLFSALFLVYKPKGIFYGFLVFFSWFISLIFYFTFFWQRQLQQTYFNYFYHHVFSYMSQNPQIQWNNLSESIRMTWNALFGIDTLISVFFACLWAFGVVWIIGVFYIRDYRSNKITQFKLYSFVNELWPFYFVYFGFVWLIQTVTIVERYVLPINTAVFLSFLFLASEMPNGNKCVKFVITCNIGLLLVRLLIIIMFV